MNIQPINSNVSMQGKGSKHHLDALKNKVTQKVIDVVPEHTVEESAKKIEAWDKIDNIISKPAENRGIMGITALLTQPAIDASNHKVDEETRRVSRNRTIAKIIAGASVGMFVVRGPLYKLIEKMTNINGDNKFSKTLLPKKYMTEISNNSKFLKNYRSALAMALALAAMSITNFALDAPLTVWLTNLLNEKTEDKTDEK